MRILNLRLQRRSLFPESRRLSCFQTNHNIRKRSPRLCSAWTISVTPFTARIPGCWRTSAKEGSPTSRCGSTVTAIFSYLHMRSLHFATVGKSAAGDQGFTLIDVRSNRMYTSTKGLLQLGEVTVLRSNTLESDNEHCAKSNSEAFSKNNERHQVIRQ
jgi:hypothetical protein